MGEKFKRDSREWQGKKVEKIEDDKSTGGGMRKEEREMKSRTHY